MATHPTVLAWRIPGMAEPGGLPVYGVTESDTTEAMQQQQQQLYCLMVSIKSSLPLLIFRKAKDN